jgi:hypothetical protein
MAAIIADERKSLSQRQLQPQLIAAAPQTPLPVAPAPSTVSPPPSPSVPPRVIAPSFDWKLDRAAGKLTLFTLDGVKPTEVLYWTCDTPVTTPPRRDFRMATGRSADEKCVGVPLKLFGAEACVRLDVFWNSHRMQPTRVTTDGNYVYESPTYSDTDTDTNTLHTGFGSGGDTDTDAFHSGFSGGGGARQAGAYTGFLFELKYATEATTTASNLRFTTQVGIYPNTYPYKACVGSQCANSTLV